MTSLTRIIFAKELQDYFKGLMSVFIFIVYLSITLITVFYFGSFMDVNNASLESFFRFQPEILALIIPAVCMHLWTDEYRLGTAEFILSQPISYASLVIGKFLAAVAFSLLMLFLTLPLVFFSSFYLDLDGGAIISGYLGCIMVILSFCAVCCAVSALSSRPIVTYLMSFFTIWGLMYFNLTPILQKAFGLQHLPSGSFLPQYINFVSGQINIGSIIYFVLLSLLGLWINMEAIKAKRG